MTARITATFSGQPTAGCCYCHLHESYCEQQRIAIGKIDIYTSRLKQLRSARGVLHKFHILAWDALGCVEMSEDPSWTFRLWKWDNYVVGKRREPISQWHSVKRPQLHSCESLKTSQVRHALKRRMTNDFLRKIGAIFISQETNVLALCGQA